MTHPRCSLSVSAGAIGWRGARLMLLAAAIGVCGWQMAPGGWSDAGRALDQALWTHALEDRATISDLQATVPVWREREGASGDRIVERVDGSHAAKTNVAVLDEVSGQAIPAPVLAEQAAEQTQPSDLPVKPARFNGLTAGDRLTITTTNGDVYTFEVVAGQSEEEANGSSIRVTLPNRDHGTVLYGIRPVASDEPTALRPQQEL
jgi:hypothetical protein